MPRRLSPATLIVGALAAAWIAWLLVIPARSSTWPPIIAGWLLVAVGSRLAARQGWVPFISANADLHALALALVYAIGVQIADSHGVTTDGAIYFSHLRSLTFDRDLAIVREFLILDQPPRPHHVVPIGPTVVWLPLYVLTASVDTVCQWIGACSAPSDPAARGLTLPYIRAALLSSFAVGALGLFVVQIRLRREFKRAVAFAATILLFGATSLSWYMVYEPSMTHAASFGLVACFVVLVERWVPHGPTDQQALVLGTLLGLAFLTRPQEVLFAVFPAVLIFSAADPLAARVQRALRLAGWAFLGAAPWLLLQAVHAYALLSMYDFAIAGEGGYLHLLDSRWADALFSSWHGFLSWTPVAYVAVLGTVAYLRRDWRWASAALLVLGLMAWINGAAEDWAGGWAFGGRRFTSTLVMLAPGLALVLEGLRRRPLLAVAPLVIAALYWNYLLMVQYTAGMLPKDAPIQFGRMVRQQAELHTRSPYVYPFAIPANLWFAWRTGLPADRYDLLATEPPRAELDLVFDTRVQRFLLEGWDAPGGDDWGSCWWIGGTPARLAVPLRLPSDRAVDIELQARTRYDEPAMQAELALEVNGEPIGTLIAGANEPTVARFTVPAERSRRVWRAGYNQIAIRHLGITRVDPSDTRPPGPLARQFERKLWPVGIYRVRIEPR